MKKICTKGFKISNADQKALDHYLMVSPYEWATNALNGMINKATKTILRDYLDDYKSSKVDTIPADISIIITEIIRMTSFKNYNTLSSENRKPERKQSANKEIWNDGFIIEDYEYLVLEAFYKEPEQTLRDLMENKISLRKAAFVKEHTAALVNDPEVIEMPTKDDDFIDLITGKSAYKNRKQREEELI